LYELELILIYELKIQNRNKIRKKYSGQFVTFEINKHTYDLNK